MSVLAAVVIDSAAAASVTMAAASAVTMTMMTRSFDYILIRYELQRC